MKTPSIPCVYDITYSVFRSDKDDFEPNDNNRVFQGLKTTSVTVTDDSDSYYHVRAVRVPTYCKPKPDPGYHGSILLHPLEKDSGGLFMSLRTKWRPVNAQSGALSYLIKGFYLGTGDSASYYERSRRCSYSHQLLDAQGFKIREIEVAFIATVGEESKVSGLESNDLSTLSNAQYKDFVSGGDWNLAWTCPKY